MSIIQQRINEIKQGRNPCFVAELKTGYVVIGDHQKYVGYTLFLCKNNSAHELHELNVVFRANFLQEMVYVSEAVWRAFKPKKLNYELLGNTDAHLHWHIFPRYENDTHPREPIWVVPKKERNTVLSKDKQREVKRRLLKALQEVYAEHRKTIPDQRKAK